MYTVTMFTKQVKQQQQQQPPYTKKKKNPYSDRFLAEVSQVIKQFSFGLGSVEDNSVHDIAGMAD